MKFLDKKEQVIDIELTQYGKYLLSKGRWNPEYYEFFDDDILYDAEWAESTDHTQNSIQERIKAVPRLEAQYLWEGVETNVKKNNSYIRSGKKNKDGVYNRLFDEFVQPKPEKDYSLSAPLGQIDPQSRYKPAWDLRVHRGEITSSNISNQDDGFPNSKIPQIDMKSITYQLVVKQGEASSTTIGQTPDPQEMFLIEESRASGGLSRPMPDGTYVVVENDYIILSLDEINSLSEEENFDIEVYEVKEEQGTIEYIPLFFEKEKEKIVDDLLVDDLTRDLFGEDIDNTRVDYFFDLRTDNEIPDDILCLLPPEVREGIYTSCEFTGENFEVYDQNTKVDEEC